MLPPPWLRWNATCVGTEDCPRRRMKEDTEEERGGEGVSGDMNLKAHFSLPTPHDEHDPVERKPMCSRSGGKRVSWGRKLQEPAAVSD